MCYCAPMTIISSFRHSVDILIISVTPKNPVLTHMQLDIISIIPALLPYPPRFSVKCPSTSARRVPREISDL